MHLENNRVVSGMQEWLQKEKNISDLFSSSTINTKYFQELKLDYLRDLYRKVSRDASVDERMTLRILRGQMRQLERRLYPNSVERLLRAIYRGFRELTKPKALLPLPGKTDWMMMIPIKATKQLNGQSQPGTKLSPTTQQHRVSSPRLVAKQRSGKRKGLRP